MSRSWDFVRGFFRIAFGLLAMAFGGLVAADEPGLTIAERGGVLLPRRLAGADGAEVGITGLSGVSWVGGDAYVAIMDNSRHLLRFRLALSDDGRPVGVSGFSVVVLAEKHDYEDVVWLPEGVAVCEEDSPAVHLFDAERGGRIRGIAVPEIFRHRRPNRGLESLALDPDGRHLWTANEEALETDGPASKVGDGTMVRVARIPIEESIDARRPDSQQFAYAVEPPHAFARLVKGEAVSGVTAIVPIGEGRLLVLERSAGPGLPPFENRIYEVNTAKAKDVSAVESGLAGRTDALLPKRQLWAGPLGVNLEGLCLGPKLAGRNAAGESRRCLVGVADDGGLETPSRIVCFELAERAATTSP